MSDGIDKHIGALTMGTDVGEEKAADGSMDGGDTVVDEIQSVDDRAVPKTVIDDQAEKFAETSGEAKGEEAEGEPDYKALYEAEQRAASGRLSDLRNVRTELTQTKQGIDQLRQVFLDKEKKEAARLVDEQRASELDEERRLYGDEVVDDPGVAYMRDKMNQTQEMIDQQSSQAEQYRQNVAAQAQQMRAAQEQWYNTQGAVKAQEDAFVEKTPDYGDAYQYSRDKRMEMYQGRGYTPQQAEIYVDQEEEGIRQEQLGRPGGSVPQAVYEIAKMYGWKPEMAKVSEKQEAQRPTSPNFSKLRQGVGSQGSGGMHGTTGSHDGSKALSAEEFFNTVPFDKRLEILSDADKFEELGRTGQIVLD